MPAASNVFGAHVDGNFAGISDRQQARAQSNRVNPEAQAPATIHSAPTGDTSFVYVAAIFAALGGLLFGYDAGVISGALIFIRQTFALSTFEQKLLVSVGS